jgi:hypothetical protein
MSYNQLYAYYLNQARQTGSGPLEYGYYTGSRFSTPYVGKGWLSSLFTKLLPSLKSAGRYAGKQLLKSGVRASGKIAGDILSGKNLKESLKETLKSEGKTLMSEGIEELQDKLGGMSGSGYSFPLAARNRRRKMRTLEAKRKSAAKARMAKLIQQLAKKSLKKSLATGAGRKKGVRTHKKRNKKNVFVRL